MNNETLVPNQDAAARQFVILDLLKDLLAYSENPGEMGSYITRQIREFLGARIVVLVQYQETLGEKGQKIVAIQPERFQKWDQMATLQELFHACQNLTSTTLLQADSPASEITQVLNKLKVRTTIVSPLKVGNELVGCLYAIDLLELIREADVAKTLEILSPIVALVLRNATFFESLETKIQERTQELRQSERQYRDLAQTVPVGIFRLDERTHHLFANEQWYELTGLHGFGGEQINFEEYIHPEDREQASQAFNQSLQTKKLTEVEFRIIRPDGQCLWVVSRIQPVMDESGEMTGTIGTLVDVSEKRRMEDAQLFLARAEWISIGEDIFKAMARFLADHLGVDYVCIDRLSGDALSAQTLAIWFDGKFDDNVKYTLRDTPCGDVVGKNICCFPSGVRHQFPKDQVLQDMKAESYLGTTLWSANGRPIGLIALIGRNAIPDSQFAESTLALIGQRAERELERRHAEEERLLTEARLERAFAASPLGMALCALNGHFLKVNPCFCSMLGMSEDEILSLDCQAITHPEDRPSDLIYFKEMAEGKRQFSQGEKRLLHKDGRDVWVQLNLSMICDSEGIPLSFMAQYQDIMDRRIAEEALKQSEAQFRSYIENAPIGVFIADQEGHYVQVNPEASRITGYTVEELLNMSIPDLLPKDIKEQSMSQFHSLIETGYSFGEFNFEHKDGHIGQWSVEAVKLSPTRFLGFVSDITERVQAEEERRRLDERINRVQALEALGVLTAGVAHNINNILAVIMGTASLHDRVSTEPLIFRDFDIISNACIRGRGVIKSLLQFAQPSLSNHAPIELHMLIKEVSLLLENTTKNSIKLIELFAEEPLWISGDSGNISHALINICINALDAMPDSGTLTLRTAVLNENMVEVSVEDSGSGMTPEVLARVMEPFYTTKEAGKGTGLGLSMTYGVIKAHGGTIDISSQPGHGTTVTLRFPRIPAPVQSEPGPVNPPSPSLTSMNVFLVDDDEDVRFLMSRMLKKAGVHQVKTFPGGKYVLEDLQSEVLPNLIILDQNMPGLTGTQTMELIRRLHQEMPILISSGQPDIEEWDCFKLPRVGVISKPFTVEEIQAKLAQFAGE